jgi:hypothetical protein
MSNRTAGAPGTLLPIAARIGDERVSSPVTWSSLAIEQETLVCRRRQSHAQPIIPPDLREKAAQSGEFRRSACEEMQELGDPSMSSIFKKGMSDVMRCTVSSILVSLAATLFLAACSKDPGPTPSRSDTSHLPEGTIQGGSLANEKLTQDTLAGVAAQVAIMGCDKPENLNPYVVAMPEGPNGAKHWKEKWIVNGCNRKFEVNISFQQTPSGVTYTIK